MINAAVVEEFLTNHYAEPVEILSLDDRVSPKTEALAFLAKSERGADRLRQELIRRWQIGWWSHYEVIFWLQKHFLVAFSDLPRKPEDWENWLAEYASRTSDPLDVVAAV